MRRKTVIVILIVLMCLGLFQIYDSPDENHKYAADLQGTINAGHQFSWLLFIGYKGGLLDQFDFTDWARSKLKEKDIQQVFRNKILDKYKAGGGKYEHELSSILYKEPEDIELVALERQQNYTAMTFKLNKRFTNSPDLPDKGGLVYSVVFSYGERPDGALWKKVLRKTANAVPFCSSFGTTGRWVVVDYNYTYNQSDYVTWYLREGDSLVNQKQKENMDSLKRLNTKEGRQEFMKSVETDVAISDIWASAWVKRLPEHIDEHLFQKTERVRNELVPGAR